MTTRVRRWLGTHRESLTAIAVIVLIFAGLVIIWGSEGREESLSVVTTETSLIPPVSYTANSWANEWEGGWRHISEASRTTTTMRASRGVKTRTVLPNHATTPAYDDGSVWTALAQCESGGRWHLDGRYDGGLQFHPDTWRSVRAKDNPDTEENEGDPDYAWQASPERQIAAAVRLQARSGWGQWPRCSRMLGLR